MTPMKSLLAVLAPVPFPPLLLVLVFQGLAWLVRATARFLCGTTKSGSARAGPRPPLSPS